jgi:hypothetical protein
MSMPEHNPPRTPRVFFSCMPSARDFVADFIRKTQFRKRLFNCRIELGNVKVGDRKKELSKRIAESDIFVAFIDKEYGAGESTQSNLEEAVKFAAQPGLQGPHEIAFLILDADGSGWWDRRIMDADIKAWRNEPGSLNCSNEQGTGPGKIDDFRDDINDLADQLKPIAMKTIVDKERMAKASSKEGEPYQVVIFGQPVREAVAPVVTARHALRQELTGYGVKVREVVQDGWGTQPPEGLQDILALAKLQDKPVFVQPADEMIAKLSAKAPDTLFDTIVEAAETDAEADKQAVRACPAVIWLPRGLDERAFREKAASQAALDPIPNPVFRTDSPAQLGEWIAGLLGVNVLPTSVRPAISYEFVPRDKAGSWDIFEDGIIPSAADPLREAHIIPPALSPFPFTDKKDVKTSLDHLARYQCGIFAIHNLTVDMPNNEEGLSRDFLLKLDAYDQILRKRELSSLKKVIRLGVIATANPGLLLYKYGDDFDGTLGEWRFIEVEVQGDRRYLPKGAHLQQFQTELERLIRQYQVAAR